MSGRRGRPKTPGLSHNKKSNTYITSSRTVPNLRSPRNKKANKFESYFKRMAPNPPFLVELATEEPSTSALPPSPTKLIVGTRTAIHLEEPTSEFSTILLSVLPIPMVESDTEMNDNDAENTDLIETINSEKKFKGRTNPPAFTLKWEKAYPWAYYNTRKSGWFCKTYEEYSNTGDHFWKTIPKRHDAHPGISFRSTNNPKNTVMRFATKLK